MRRHMEKAHKEEHDVKVALAMTDEKKKQAYFNRLRLKGNHYHNVRVLQTGTGQLLVLRRPKEGQAHSTEDYTPCPDCLGYVYKRDLWKHRQVCIAAGQDESKKNSTGRKMHFAESQRILNASVKKMTPTCDLQTYVLPVMVNDNIKITAKNDATIISYGKGILDRVGKQKGAYVSTKMREVSRFLMVMKVQDPNVTQLSDVFDPSKFETVIASVKEVCDYSRQDKDSNPGVFKTPSLALKLGYSLKACAEIVKGQAIINDDQTTVEKVDKFLFLHQCKHSGYSARVSSHALKTLYNKKASQPDVLPVTSDLLKLRKYLSEEIQKHTLSLLRDPNTDSHFGLSSATAARMILFNKRRGGEAMKVTIEAYRQREWEQNRSK
ncbi:hypothetical protein HOLleu_03587 [Holothuria leucospilota]|uniref:Uncharacterized protein n=1 Tax=Holothuria leucospilota TaxID=206669 RepID=A0A9Q1CS65_HOLLE|nr:hypothetical protein HOLleu_03587 [Holothuria leucospilota]